jgi:uncharacterized protein YdeI (YjbR/CyaY-like superfamily)
MLLEFVTPDEWEGWLDTNHGAEPEAWLRFAKKDSGVESINYAQALDVALRFGWIDSQVRRIDEQFYRQRFTPRRATSIWSKRNCDRVTELIGLGLVRPAGLAEVAKAKADGRWDRAYDGPKNAAVPEDLQAALDARPEAGEFFATLDGHNRYAILFRVGQAKRPETRARRIAQFVDMLAKGEKLHP